ncbi:uncharacterized protein PV07_05612 [Cladophialophora immunda]|uniref:Transcription factor domain-containing protein n=1 Tax=Cladophialophora immunda TaxID=569365 RepID=A0A0D2CI33_9EURO|nr:uncharacterized protein PV07_05612 [Cladophialophora immunda]KIW29825.1 hypothetical protein PV07_05612 [Cladophialophora immunda]
MVTGRTCDGYAVIVQPREALSLTWKPPVTVVGMVLSTLPHDEKPWGLGLLCLDAFRSQVISALFDDPSRRLERLILQALNQESCVRHAAVALTAHQLQASSRWPAGGNGDGATNFGLNSYSLSIRDLRKLLLRPPDRHAAEVALVCALLGICYELAQGAYNGARLHLENGLRVCSSLSVDDDIFHEFARLDVQGSTFIEGWVPRLTPLLPTNTTAAADNDDDDYDGDGVRFDSLETAQRYLYACLSRLWSFLRGTLDNSHRYWNPDDRPPHIANQSRNLVARLQRWELIYDEFVSRLDRFPNTYTQAHSNLLRIHHQTAQVYLATALSPDELCYDDHDDSFRLIVSLSRSLLHHRQSHAIPTLFSLGLGVVQPLFFTATRCRNLWVRDEAIELLSAVPCTEGVWNAPAMTKIAAVVKDLEERDLDRAFLEQHRIPEAKRVHSTSTDIDPRRRSSEVRCTRLPSGRTGAWEHHFFQVCW